MNCQTSGLTMEYWPRCLNANGDQHVCSYAKGVKEIRFMPNAVISLSINMTNLPIGVSYTDYVLINDRTKEEKPLKKSEMIEGSTERYFVRKMSEQHHQMTLYMKLLFNNRLCATKPVVTFRRVFKHYEASLDCYVNKTCSTSIDWNNECVIEVLKNRVNSMLNTTSPIELRYSEGSRIRYTCTTDYNESYVAWLHKKGHHPINKLKHGLKKPVTIDILLTRFDSDTTISCLVYSSSRKNEQIDSSYDTTLVWDESTLDLQGQNTSLGFQEQVIRYHEGDTKDLACDGCNHTLWNKIIDNTLDLKFEQRPLLNSPSLLTLHNLTSEYDDVAFVCTTYVLDRQTYTRIVAGMYMLKMEDNVAEYHTQRSNSPYFILGGVLLAGLASVVTWKLWCSPSRRPTRVPHEVETYACAGAVQYVQVDTGPPGDTHLKHRQDTPYAQIVGVLQHK